MLSNMAQAYRRMKKHPLDMTNEEKAVAVGASRSKLRKRLLEARSVLTTASRKEFGKGTFDFENKRLVSDDGTWALQWRVRMNPNKPEDSRNQQTNTGVVVFFGNMAQA